MENRTYFSLLHRFLHWTIAMGILLALFTAFLHHFWMNAHDIATTLTSSLAEKNITLSPDDAFMIARKISFPMFTWHFYAGFALVALLILRFIDFFVYGRKFISPLSKTATSRQKFQGWLYVLLYIALTLILIMGLLLRFGPRNEYHEIIDKVHVWCGYFIALFVVLHFGGLLLGEIGDDKGIVSKMINGKS